MGTERNIVDLRTNANEEVDLTIEPVSHLYIPLACYSELKIIRIRYHTLAKMLKFRN